LIKVRIDIDSQPGADPILGIHVADAEGQELEHTLEVRDYGRGDTPDEGGALYENVTDEFKWAAE
jgi:hypothetical protein